MEKLYELKQAEAKNKALIMAHDITINERNEVKTLVDEAKEKTQNKKLRGNRFMWSEANKIK